jgi:hypothetical protein
MELGAQFTFFILLGSFLWVLAAAFGNMGKQSTPLVS